MLSLIFIYFLGKYFYTLAETYDKSKWGYAIPGLATYYGSTFFVTSLIAIILAFTLGEAAVDNFANDKLLLTFMSIGVGIVSCILLYKFLENRWTKQLNRAFPEQADILDA